MTPILGQPPALRGDGRYAIKTQKHDDQMGSATKPVGQTQEAHTCAQGVRAGLATVRLRPRNNCPQARGGCEADAIGGAGQTSLHSGSLAHPWLR